MGGGVGPAALSWTELALTNSHITSNRRIVFLRILSSLELSSRRSKRLVIFFLGSGETYNVIGQKPGEGIQVQRGILSPIQAISASRQERIKNRTNLPVQNPM
jgi:hypothetical protein